MRIQKTVFVAPFVATGALVVILVWGCALTQAGVPSGVPTNYTGTGKYCEITNQAVSKEWRCSGVRDTFSFLLTKKRNEITNFIGQFGPAVCGVHAAHIGLGDIEVKNHRTVSYESNLSTPEPGAYTFSTSSKPKAGETKVDAAKRFKQLSLNPVEFIVRGRLSGSSTATITYEVEAFRTGSAAAANGINGPCYARVTGVARRI